MAHAPTNETPEREIIMKKLMLPFLLGTIIAVTACKNEGIESPDMTVAQTPANLNNLEIAHVAYTADNIDIRYANIALKRSRNPEIHAFAQTMIRDHTAVNELALGLLEKLGASAQDNFLSRKLNADSEVIVTKLNSLSGPEFDRYYASNELAYHKAVNGLVENSFIPNIDNGEVKELFEAGLEIFKGHQEHAQMMVNNLGH